MDVDEDDEGVGGREREGEKNKVKSIGRDLRFGREGRRDREKCYKWMD